MMLKERVARAGTSLRRRGKELLQNPSLILAIECGTRFLLTLLLSRAKIFGSYAPFGVAMLAASGPGLRGGAAMVGALLGYLVMGGLDWGLKYIAMCVLILSAAFIFRELDFSRKSFFAPLIAAFTAAVTGFVYLSEASFSLQALVFYITETVLAGGCTLFYALALSPWNREQADSDLRHRVCILILGATVLISLSRLQLAGIISIGRCGAVLAVMIAARRSGMGLGAAFGISLGLAMDAALGRSVFFSMVYAFSGLIAGAFFRQKRLLFTLSCILGNLIAVLWVWESSLRVASLYEVFIASVIFMVLPAGLLMGTTDSSTHGAALRRSRARQLSQIAAALQELQTRLRASLRQTPPNDSDPGKLFVRAASLTCRNCRRVTRCWQVDHGLTMDALNKAAPAMLERGELRSSDLPAHFSENCLHTENFVSAVNDSFRAALYRRQYRARVQENQAAALAQYGELAQILDEAAKSLSEDHSHEAELETRLRRYLQGMGAPAEVSIWREQDRRLRAEVSGSLADFTAKPDFLDKLSAVMGMRLCLRGELSNSHLSLLEAEPLAAAVGVASMRRSGQSVCGDSECFFKTDAGLLYVLLSDGMGSGEAASRLSREAISVLERFIRAGVRPEGALRLLSSAMNLRGDEQGCTTADIFCADLFRGTGHICKCGAAPTYVRRGRHLRRITCANSAVGLAGSCPERTELELPAGTLAVMLSDGLLDGQDDKWLRDRLMHFSGSDVKALAGDILSAATALHGGEDDMTVLCILLSRRE